MRFYEISSGLRIPVSEEEQTLLDAAIEHGTLDKSSLDERQQEVARLMVSRGLFMRERKDNEICFRPNSAADVWRF